MTFLDNLLFLRWMSIVDADTLTSWWVRGTLLIFFIALIYYLYRWITLNSSLKKFSEDADSNVSGFKAIWQAYNETFFDFNGERKTFSYSDYFFNKKNLLNIRLLASIPSILVGLGILGTFVGLTRGITDFKMASAEQIKDSIEILLSGMSTAFITSIWGMSLSLVFTTVLEKPMMRSLYKSIRNLCYKLDRRYMISKEDQDKIEWARQEKTISEYFIFKDDNDNRVKPANFFRDIYDESAKQTQAMQTFSTDLAVKIDAGFERILNNSIQKEVIPEIQSLKTEIENLGKKLQAPAAEMTQSIVKDLESALSDMINEFKTSLSGTTKSELESLAKLIGKAGGSLTDFPDKVSMMTENLNENFRSMQEVFRKIAGETISQSNESTELMKKQVEDMSEILKEKVGELQVGQEVLIAKQSENLKFSADLLVHFNESIEKMNALSTSVTDTILKFGTAQNELNITAQHLKLISKNANESLNDLKESQYKFSRYSEEISKANSHMLEEIQKSFSKAKEVSADYAEKFIIIEKGLQSIFEKIHEGLLEYRNTVGGSLDKFLGRYTAELGKSTESLAGAAGKYEDILDELTEQLSRLNQKRN